MVSDNALAIILGVIANSIYNIGLVFKRKGACTLPEIEEQTAWQNIKNFAKCKSWVFGFSLTILQWFPLMYAVKIGSLSLVAPTMAIGFVVLVLFSWFILKEPIRIIEIIGILTVMSGLVALYVIAPIESGNYDLTEMNTFFRETNAIVYLCAFVVIIGVLISITYGRKYAQAGGLLAMASGLSYATATIFAKGAIGSLTFANAADFLKNSLSAWQWWIYLFLMCLGYFVAFTSQQIALQKGKALVVSPTIDIMNLFMQVMAGIFVFNEWLYIWENELVTWQKSLKVISIILIIAGVALLSFFAKKDELETEEEETEEKTEQEIPEEIIETESEEELAKELEELEKKPILISLEEKIRPDKIKETKQSSANYNK
ncbi:MAG: hypothetical protein FK732_09635 [Asgard group archaeon]|nr:hypothetical protein [Asgard group archaeon]